MMTIRYQLFTKILLFLILVLVLCFSIAKIYDYDIWWHLKTGEHILKTFKIPYQDIFSLTDQGKDWIDVHWFSQLLLFSVFSLAGFTGTQLSVFCVVAFTIFILYKIRSNEGLYRLSILPLIYLAIYASKDRYLPRPDVFSLLFSSLYFFILYRFQFQNKKTIYLLPILQVFWVNMHGSFILGPLILLAFTAGQFLELIFSRQKKNIKIPAEQAAEYPRSKQRQIEKTRLYSLLIVLFIVLAVNLINPYGIKIYTLFGTYLESFHQFFLSSSESLPPVTIQEWLPTFSESATKYHHTFFPFYVILVILGFLSFILNIKRFSPQLFITFSGFLLLSIFAIRNVSLFCLLTAAITAHNLFKSLSGFTRARIKRKWLGAILPAFLFVIFSFLIMYSIFDVVSNRYYIKHNLPMETSFGVSRFPFPFGAAEFIKEEKVAGNLYNNFETGGFLIWALYPEYKVFIDGRYIDPEFSRINIQAAKDYEKWKELVNRYNVECAILKFPSMDTTYLITVLSASNQWKIVYLDWNSIIFMKDSQRNQRIIEEYSLNLPEFSERAHMKKARFPFRKDLFPQFIEKEFHKNAVDRYFSLISTYLEKFQEDPFPVKILNRGYLLHLIGAYSASVDEYQKVLHMYPDYEPAHFELGLLYLQLGDYQKSLDEMKMLLERGVNNFETFYHAGLASFHLHRSKEAIHFFENAMEWKPKDYSSHFLLSLSHLNSGNIYEAERHMKMAIEIDPDSAEAHFNLGSIYLLKKDKIQAMQRFQKALKINPAFKDAQEELEKLNL